VRSLDAQRCDIGRVSGRGCQVAKALMSNAWNPDSEQLDMQSQNSSVWLGSERSLQNCGIVSTLAAAITDRVRNRSSAVLVAASRPAVCWGHGRISLREERNGSHQRHEQHRQPARNTL
jgi:hypothetical protein